MNHTVKVMAVTDNHTRPERPITIITMNLNGFERLTDYQQEAIRTHAQKIVEQFGYTVTNCTETTSENF